MTAGGRQANIKARYGYCMAGSDYSCFNSCLVNVTWIILFCCQLMPISCQFQHCKSLLSFTVYHLCKCNEHYSKLSDCSQLTSCRCYCRNDNEVYVYRLLKANKKRVIKTARKNIVNAEVDILRLFYFCNNLL